MPTHSYNALVRVGNVNTNGAARNSSGGSSSGKQDLTGAVSVSLDLPNNSVEVSELGDSAIRRLDGKADFTPDVDVNLDFTLALHRELMELGVRDGEEYIVNVIPDVNSGGAGSRTGLQSRCVVTSSSFELPPDSNQTITYSFENSDGAVWEYRTDL